MRASRARSESVHCWLMESAIRSAFRSRKIVLTKFPWQMRSSKTLTKRPPPNSQLSTSQLSFDPFSYQRRATEKIERNGVKLGGDELIRVVVRQATFDKIAHKIDRMGDYKPEIVYEDADIIAIDPRDDAAIAKLNAAANCAVCHGRRRNRSPGHRSIPFAGGEVARAPSDSVEGRVSVGAVDRNGPAIAAIAAAQISSDSAHRFHQHRLASLRRHRRRDFGSGRRRRRDKRFVCRTTFYRQPARAFSKLIMSLARPADERCSICKPRRRKSKQPPCT